MASEANYDSSVRHKCVLNLQSVSGHFLLLLLNTESELIMLLKDRLITYQGAKKSPKTFLLSCDSILELTQTFKKKHFLFSEGCKIQLPQKNISLVRSKLI